MKARKVAVHRLGGPAGLADGQRLELFSETAPAARAYLTREAGEALLTVKRRQAIRAMTDAAISGRDPGWTFDRRFAAAFAAVSADLDHRAEGATLLVVEVEEEGPFSEHDAELLEFGEFKASAFPIDDAQLRERETAAYERALAALTLTMEGETALSDRLGGAVYLLDGVGTIHLDRLRGT